MSKSLILKLGLLNYEKVVLVEVLNSRGIVLFGADIKLQLTKLLVTGFLERTELKDQLLVALRFVTKVSLQLGDATLLLILALSQVLDLPLVEIG